MESWIRIVTKCLDPYFIGLSSIQIAIGLYWMFDLSAQVNDYLIKHVVLYVCVHVCACFLAVIETFLRVNKCQEKLKEIGTI